MDPPSSLDLESTSKLLARLDLIEGDRSKKIEGMDAELVLEVPDTPDRMARSSPVLLSSGASTRRKDDVVEIDTPSSGQRIGPARKRYDHFWRDSAPSDTGTSTTARSYATARLVPKTLETKPSPKSQGEVLGIDQTRVFNDNGSSPKARTVDLGQKTTSSLFHPARRGGPRRKKGKELCLDSGVSESGLTNPSDKGKGIAISTNLHYKTKQPLSRALQPDATQRNMQRRRLVHNSDIGYISPCNATKSHTSCEVGGQNIINPIDGNAHPPSLKFRDEDSMKERYLYEQLQNTEPRRLEWGGCVTSDVAQGKNVMKDGDVGKVVLNKHLYGVSFHQAHFEGSHADKKKEKVRSDDNATSDMQPVKAKGRSGRSRSVSGKEVTVVGDDDDVLGSSEDLGWWTAHDLAKNASIDSIRGSTNNYKEGEDTSSHLSDTRHEIATGERNYVNLVHDSSETTTFHHKSNPSAAQASSVTESESRRRQRRQKLAKGKRKGNSAYSIYGECSSSTLEDSEFSYRRSSGRNTNLKLRTSDSDHNGIVLGPSMEDELHFPAVTWDNPQEQSSRVSDDFSARAWQVESDEMLARQLQEQFYQEFEGTEEDTRQPSSIGRRGQLNPRDTTIAHSYAYNPRLPFQNSSARSTNRPRVPTSSRMTQMRRNFMDLETRLMAEVRRNFNSAEMDLEMRDDVLGALEAAFDISNDMLEENVLQIHRDFNENDYEMLLALDENNYQNAGASESQINTLPQSIIQSENVEETCAVCLETPLVGDVIRHLPCLHKFHKECIDKWLRMKTLCPVCKSDVA